MVKLDAVYTRKENTVSGKKLLLFQCPGSSDDNLKEEGELIVDELLSGNTILNCHKAQWTSSGWAFYRLRCAVISFNGFRRAGHFLWTPSGWAFYGLRQTGHFLNYCWY